VHVQCLRIGSALGIEMTGKDKGTQVEPQGSFDDFLREMGGAVVMQGASQRKSIEEIVAGQ